MLIAITLRLVLAFPNSSALDTTVVRYAIGEAARIWAPYGIVIAIEPLRRQETNIVNTAAEGLDLVTAVDHPNFQLMIDFYHLASEHEDPAIVLKARDHLRHLHVANPNGRVFPQRWDEYDYAPFFANLKAIGLRRATDVVGGFRAWRAAGLPVASPGPATRPPPHA